MKKFDFIIKKPITTTLSAILIITVLYLMATSSTTVAQSNLNDSALSQFNNDTTAVKLARDNYINLIKYMESTDKLFLKKDSRKKRLLVEKEKEEILLLWRTFLDLSYSLDAIGGKYDDLYKASSNGERAKYFRLTLATFVTQYRFAMEFLNITGRDPSMDVLLNEANRNLAIEKNEYRKIKFRFLNALRGTEFTRLRTVYKYYNEDPQFLLTEEIEIDARAIWKFGMGRGPEQTVKNAVKIVGDSIFTAWFPVQREISETMGEIKVLRHDKALITDLQIKDLQSIIRPGDILLERREWYLTNIGIPGFWTHAAVYIGTPSERAKYLSSAEVNTWVKSKNKNATSIDDLIKKDFKKPYKLSLKKDKKGHDIRVIEAIAKGVSLTSLEYTSHADSIVILRPKISDKAKARAIYRAFSYQGRPYDYNFDFVSDASLVCTELVFKSFESSTDIEGIKFPVKKVMGKLIMPANDIVEMIDKKMTNGIKTQFEIVKFLDGYEFEGKAKEASIKTFRQTWKRPKFHILVKETPLSRENNDS